VSIKIEEEKFPALENGSEKEILKGVIASAKIIAHKIDVSKTLSIPGSANIISILFLCSGAAKFLCEDVEYEYSTQAVFVGTPSANTTITAISDCTIIEILLPMTQNLDKTKFPYSAKYLDSEQYRDASKSEKSVSRMVLPFGFIAGFDFGSVETTGIDRVEKHQHPKKDQVFYSFSENDVDLLIDDEEYPLKGNTFIHIPLASNHGVKVNEGKKAHYLWFDFEIA